MLETCVSKKAIGSFSFFHCCFSTSASSASTSNPTERIKANKTTILTVKPISESARTPDKKAPGIDTPTRKPERIPRAPKIIIKTKIS